MHLTNNPDERHLAEAESANAETAGAPDGELITREMLDAGRDVIERCWVSFTGPTGFLLWDEVLRKVFLAMKEARPR